MATNDSKETRPRWGTRKSLIVTPAFQWKYTAMIVVSVFVFSTIMSTALYGFLYEQARARTVYMSSTSQMETMVSIVIASLMLFKADARSSPWLIHPGKAGQYTE